MAYKIAVPSSVKVYRKAKIFFSDALSEARAAAADAGGGSNRCNSRKQRYATEKKRCESKVKLGCRGMSFECYLCEFVELC